MENKPKHNDGKFWLFVSLAMMVAVFSLGLWLIGSIGCVPVTSKSNNEFVGPEYVAGDNRPKVDASSSFATVKMLEDAKIELKTTVQAEVAAQINKIGGDQNSTWVFALAVMSGPAALLIDKLSRRSKTIRKIDAVVKGHKKMTVSE